MDHPFERTVAEYIGRHGLLHRNAPVIVALSGGADSVALLAALLALGYDCRAAHCNYHLRGEESMRDMRHCHDICGALDVDLYVRDFDVDSYRAVHPGQSVEMVCRDMRYSWFGELLDREGAQAVAVGHHLEDRVETAMLNMLRGAGITGLTSMRPRSGSTIRPLLATTRADIENYLVDRGLCYITDSSNRSDVHRRNRLRNHVFPLLEEMFPGATDAMTRSIGHLEAAYTIYRDGIEQRRKRYMSDGTIDLVTLIACEPEAPTVLFELLRPLGYTFTQITDMIGAAQGSGAYFRSTDGTTVVDISRGTLHISDARRLALDAEDVYAVMPRHDILEPIHIRISRHPVADFAPERSPYTAYIDAAGIDTPARWELRHWRRGDRMIPYGSNSSKLVSDIFADARYSAPQKRAAWILTRDDEIVWIPGLRASAHFAIGPDTKEYIRMEADGSAKR